MSDLENLVNFFIDANSLKKTIRYNSCPEFVQEPTAGHSWMLTFMIPIVAEKLEIDINIQHVMEIANVHDLPEYKRKYDFDSYNLARGVESQNDKDKEEEEIMGRIRDNFDFGQRLYLLWREYQDCQTPEAKFVRALDKIETFIHITERGGTGEDINDAAHQALYADESVKNFPQLKPLLRAVKKKARPVLEAQGLIWDKKYDYPD